MALGPVGEDHRRISSGDAAAKLPKFLKKGINTPKEPLYPSQLYPDNWRRSRLALRAGVFAHVVAPHDRWSSAQMAAWCIILSRWVSTYISGYR
jgi:hypothetical protein